MRESESVSSLLIILFNVFAEPPALSSCPTLVAPSLEEWVWLGIPTPLAVTLLSQLPPVPG